MTDFHKTILFTKTPLNRVFRYGDLFQIYPAELEKMPTSKLQAHFPVILEYTTQEEDRITPPNLLEGLEDLESLAATTLTKSGEIMNLLTLVSNHSFFTYKDRNGRWAMPIYKEDAGEEANTWSSKWTLPLFHWPELPGQLKINEFSDPPMDAIETKPHLEYYTQNPNLDFKKDEPIHFSDSTNRVLEAYYALTPEEKKVIDAAISHCVTAVELKDQKKTMSIIAAFTTIETMVNYENTAQKAEPCGTCGQPQFKVSQKFRGFLLKYIGESDANKRKFNKYYTLRSKIVHTGSQLETENLYNDVPEDKRENEFITHLEILQLARLSIINWLIKHEDVE